MTITIASVSTNFLAFHEGAGPAARAVSCLKCSQINVILLRAYYLRRLADLKKRAFPRLLARYANMVKLIDAIELSCPKIK
ncbi:MULTISPECIES: hypothetical protein [Pantoea]|uniref:hypothetical protein n=1 Tax=Pantoea TaxID=53335 RepID=UPI0012E06072|nr:MULTISPECIES: hypothetical protein [Pantoea]